MFEPVNDTDDYTMVTAYINEEFARVQREEKGEDKAKGDPVNDPVNDLAQITEPLSKKEKQILVAICKSSSITRKELAEQLQCSDSTIKRNLASLVNKGIIERVGSDKTGSWLIKTLNN